MHITPSALYPYPSVCKNYFVEGSVISGHVPLPGTSAFLRGRAGEGQTKPARQLCALLMAKFWTE